MNITFLIGNGFDLNLGLKTDYKSFYSYYKMRSKSNIAKSIDSEYELWSDLEKGLGEYTARLKTQQDVEKFLDEKEELEKHLINYLKLENKKFRIVDGKQLAQRFSKSISELSIQFSKKDRQAFKTLLGQKGSINYNFIVFNYTNILDKIIEETNKNQKPFLTHISSNTQYSDFLKEPLHVHGSLRGGLILGVNDASQIANDKLQNDSEFLRYMLKPTLNDDCGELNTENAQTIINESFFICIFGLSIGDTDNIWWQTVIRWLLKDFNHRLIFFVRDDTMVSESAMTKSRHGNKNKKILTNKVVKLTDEEFKRIESQIIVVPNSKIFDLQGVSVTEENKSFNDLRKAAEKRAATEQLLNAMKNEWDNEFEKERQGKKDIAKALNAK